MTDWLNNLKDTVSVLVDREVILGIGCSLAIASAIIPPVGIGRALTLGWRSYFRKNNPLSARTSEIRKITKSLVSMEKGSYLTVIGEKGEGKTCLIDTALNRQHGVVKIDVSCLS